MCECVRLHKTDHDLFICFGRTSTATLTLNTHNLSPPSLIPQVGADVVTGPLLPSASSSSPIQHSDGRILTGVSKKYTHSHTATNPSCSQTTQSTPLLLDLSMSMVLGLMLSGVFFKRLCCSLFCPPRTSGRGKQQDDQSILHVVGGQTKETVNSNVFKVYPFLERKLRFFEHCIIAMQFIEFCSSLFLFGVFRTNFQLNLTLKFFQYKNGYNF